MPYIKPDERNEFARETPVTIGQLNYAITMLCQDFIGSRPSYSEYNEIVGVLECAKQEFYRRAMVPYEDEKIKENGDVY